LIIEFNKGDDASANTNLAGRDYIKTIVNGSVTPPVGPVDLLSMAAVIENDDKFNLYISSKGDPCSLTDESNSSACEYEINWYNKDAQMQSLTDSVGVANTAEASLASPINVAESKDADADTATGNISQQSTARWANESEITDAKDAADTALENAQTAKASAEAAIEDSDAVIISADDALLAAATAGAIEDANTIKNAALAAKEAATKAKSAAVAAENAANAALNAVAAASKAKDDYGRNDPLIGYWDKYDAAVAAANDASTAAESATTKATTVISTANDITLLAELALKRANSISVVPVVDPDAGEISLAMTLTGAVSNIETPVSAQDSTVKDPQDYKIEFENCNGGSVTEQGANKILLKASDVAMANLPRTLTLTLVDDVFMEPAEEIGVALSAVTNSDNNEYIETFSGLNYSSTILANDTATITVNQTSSTNGSEGNSSNSVVTYAVELTGLIAINAPNISLSTDPEPAVDGKVDGKTAADSTDYSISDLTIHTQGSKETLSFNKTLDLTINSDNTLELDELVKLNLAVSGGTLAGIDEINYTIENDDAVVINITSATSMEEGTTAVGTATLDTKNNTITYTLNSANADAADGELIVAANYPNITLSHNVVGSTATSGTDFSALSDVNIHSVDTSKNNGDATAQNLVIVNDRIVEKDESIKITFTENVADADDATIKVKAGDDSVLSFTITNDDYIHLSFTCDNAECPAVMTEGDTMTLKVDANYESELGDSSLLNVGLAVIPDVGSTSNVNESGSALISDDYTLKTITLDANGTAGATHTELLHLIVDNMIENNETLNLSLAKSDYVELTLPQDGQYTIANDEYLTVKRTYSLPNPDPDNATPIKTAVLSDGGTLGLEFCVPTNKTFDINTGNLKFFIDAQNINLDASSSHGKATCDDITLLNTTTSCNLVDGFSSEKHDLDVKTITTSKCLSVELLNAAENTTSNQNTALALQMTNLTDDRVDPNAVDFTKDAQEIVIINDNFTNMLDTGLTQCIQNGLTGKWAVDCNLVDEDFGLQDAATTNTIAQYPNLAYTYINASGEPVITKPDSGAVCVQDNNTGYIWSSTIVKSDSTNGFNREDGSYPNMTESTFTNYACGFVSGDTGNWVHPTVEDLLTIWDAEKLKAPREFDFLVSLDNGNPVTASTAIDGTHFMRYWSSEGENTICANNEHLAVDFLNGQVACFNRNKESSVIMVYK